MAEPGTCDAIIVGAGLAGLYQQTCDQIAASGYEGFALTGAAAHATAV